MTNLESAILKESRSSFFVIQANGTISFASRGIYTFEASFFKDRGVDAFDFVLAESAKLGFSELLNQALGGWGETVSRVFESINLEVVEESRYLKFVIHSVFDGAEAKLILEVFDYTKEVVAELKIKQREAELNLFGQIAYAKHRYLDNEVLFRNILKLIAEAVKTDTLLLFTGEEEEESQVLVASYSPDEELTTITLPARLSRLNRVDYGAVKHKVWKDQGFVSRLVVPLTLHNDKIGTLVLLSYETHFLTWLQIRLLRRVGEYISVIAATELLWRQKEQLGAITKDVFANAGDGLFILDQNGVIKDKNPKAEAFLNDKTNISQAVGRASQSAIENFVQRLNQTGRAAIQTSFKDSPNKMYEITGSIIKNSNPIRFLCVARDVSEWVVKQAGLKRRALELERLDRMKDEFISLVSHELRSPLTVLKGNISLMSKEVGREQDSVATMEAMTNNLGRLERLVNDILEITKLEYGRIEFNLSQMSTNQLATEVEESVHRVIVAKQIKWHSDIEKLKLINDGDRIFQVVYNLVENAVKIVDQRGVVGLSIKSIPSDNIEIKITDNGPGLSKEQQDSIFELFYRGHDRYSGTGLGLYIVAKLVHRMGGQVKVVSQPGQGATFTVLIPRKIS